MTLMYHSISPHHTRLCRNELIYIKVWPAQAGTFSVRVWTGRIATQPANMVVDQALPRT